MTMGYEQLFVQSLNELNQFAFHRAVLHYQQEIVERGSFSLNSPWSGERLVPTICHVVNNGDPAHGNIGIAYRVSCEEPFWLMAGSIKDGFPITEAYLPSQDTALWSLGEAYHAENRSWRACLQALEADLDAGALPEVQSQGAVVLLGHPNFAHNLWNELPAIYAYTEADNSERTAGDGELRIKVIYEPLLPLEELVINTAVSVTSIDSFEELVGFQDVMLTRLGSTQIPGDLRGKIRRLLRERHDQSHTDPLVASLRGFSPVIWLSVRLDARTMDNQTEFLQSLVASIAAEYPDAGFIMDGFSYPYDFGSPIYQQQDKTGPRQFLRAGSVHRDGFLTRAMRAREREISACVRSLQKTLEKRVPNPIVNVSGMNLADAIYLGQEANYYVCHAGTLQHKIAWIYNIDGIVHSNTTGVQKGVQNWLADQLEGGVKPSLLCAEYVRDLDSIRTTNKVERNRDYHIIDVGRVVEQILGDLQVSMARRPGASIT